MERRLAAILAADVAGYSRLMEQDEAGTLGALNAHREDVINPAITKHHGRVVKLMGDGILVEFPSVVEAVQCAVQVQTGLAKKNANVPEELRMEWRVGINVGDVIVEGDDIYGDGINVASRLEGLAEPGGILISRNVFTQVKNKVNLGFESLGEQKVKNIAEPVLAFRVLREGETAAPTARPKPHPRIVAAAVAVLAVLIAGGGLWWWQAQQTDFKPADAAKYAFPLPEKPSIAVLSFDNLSNDESLDFLGDSLADEIIARLAIRPDIFVIARNSSFSYKGKPVKVQQVAEELGVQYVLEGSVQRSGDKLRVIAQLVDAAKGIHLWVGRYDRDSKDLFEIQDDIAAELHHAMGVTLTVGDLWTHIKAPPGTDIRARELHWRGTELVLRFNKIDNTQSRKLRIEALKLAPNWHALKVLIAWNHLFDVLYGWTDDPEISFASAIRLADDAKANDLAMPSLSDLYAFAALLEGRHDEAVALGQEGLALGPNDADAHAVLAYFLNNAGRPGDAILLFQKAMRLAPFYPDWYLEDLGKSYYLAGRIEDAINALTEQLKRNPKNQNSQVYLAGIYGQLGRIDEAKALAQQIMQQSPDYTIGQFVTSEPLKDPSVLDALIKALGNAGIPD
jgi:TolB-like protein/class 3 adenylate cyclase